MYFNHLQCIPSYQGYPFTQFFLIPKRKEKERNKKEKKKQTGNNFLTGVIFKPRDSEF